MPTPEPPLWANPQYLLDLCEAIRAYVAGFLSTPVDRSYVCLGAPPWDAGLGANGCESQLTVSLDRVRGSLQPTLNQLLPQGSKQTVPVADIEVVLLRCALTMHGRQIPSSTELGVESLALYTEGQTLWGDLVTASMAGTLFPTMHGSQFLWRSMEAVGPNGGLAGWKLKLEVGLA